MCEFHDMEVEPFETYSYYVEAVYSDGCTSACDPIEVIVDQGTGVVENSYVQVKVFPNPAEGFVNVTAEGLQNITLIDVMGRIVKEQSASQSATVVDLSNLPTGLYFLRVTTDNGVALQRVEVKWVIFKISIVRKSSENSEISSLFIFIKLTFIIENQIVMK